MTTDVYRGANLVAISPDLHAHAIVHPGAQTSAAAAEKLHSPTCLLPSMNEDEQTVSHKLRNERFEGRESGFQPS
jgi:hypothetical protein